MEDVIKSNHKMDLNEEIVRSVCKPDACTMCGSCREICPCSCLHDRQVDDRWFMVIDETKCVSCGLCRKVCPNLQNVEKHRPLQAYAAWAVDSEVRKNSASGGLAAIIYREFAAHGGMFAGVSLNERFEVHFRLTDDVAAIRYFQNSKYTFSFMDHVLTETDKALQIGKKVVLIGLPCQIAAVRTTMAWKKRDIKNLWLVDIICHGTPLPSHLKEHIKAIEGKIYTHFTQCSFRDPRYGTQNFIFTLDDTENGHAKYAKDVKSEDCFQIGYHQALIYRDCCYQCPYACNERVGDLTLSDYWGLGEEIPYKGEKEKISCVLVNTPKGRTLIDELIRDHKIVATERPVQEAILHQPLLNHPSIGGEVRQRFKEAFSQCKNFEEAAQQAFQPIIRKNRLYSALQIKKLKKIAKAILPNSMKQWLRSRHNRV